jgi:hypothetical protein
MSDEIEQYKAWARYLLVHSPAFTDAVLNGFPMQRAMEVTAQRSGCNPGICAHPMPTITPEELVAADQKNEEI